MRSNRNNKLKLSKYSWGFLLLFLFSFTSGIASSFSASALDKINYKEFSYNCMENSSGSSSAGFLFNEIEEDEDNLEPCFTLLPDFLVIEPIDGVLNKTNETKLSVHFSRISIFLIVGDLRI